MWLDGGGGRVWDRAAGRAGPAGPIGLASGHYSLQARGSSRRLGRL